MTPEDRLVYSTDPGRGRAGDARTKPEAADTPRRAGDQRVYVERERKGRRGKTVTVITGLPGDDAEQRRMLKHFKGVCGAGGTLKDGQLEVQGDHGDRLVELLREMGYQAVSKGG